MSIILIRSQKVYNFLCKLLLQSQLGYGIIYKRDCNRYAMKRKVAGGMSGNFRGVCPILNRATEILEHS